MSMLAAKSAWVVMSHCVLHLSARSRAEMEGWMLAHSALDVYVHLSLLLSLGVAALASTQLNTMTGKLKLAVAFDVPSAVRYSSYLDLNL